MLSERSGPKNGAAVHSPGRCPGYVTNGDLAELRSKLGSTWRTCSTAPCGVLPSLLTQPDLRSSLLTLDRVQANLTLLSLTRRLGEVTTNGGCIFHPAHPPLRYVCTGLLSLRSVVPSWHNAPIGTNWILLQKISFVLFLDPILSLSVTPAGMPSACLRVRYFIFFRSFRCSPI